MRNVSGETLRKNQNTHFMFSNYFSKIVPSMKYFGKNIVEPETPQMTDNMGHALCTLDILGYQHALKVCKTCFFPTATMFARTGLIVTL